MTFASFFEQATGFTPFPYQFRLAEGLEFPETLEVPTGGGKTAFAILAWLWRRRHAAPAVRANTPRRLIYCLPVRTLVDQTFNVTARWVDNLGLREEVGVHAMMGGDLDASWEMSPEREAVVIGTQDQLLSRALNRGYSMSRYRWPVHFGLLNSDVLWVLDETQLMGVGLSTSAQLHAFRTGLGTYGPVRSMWMSATLDARKLATIDLRNTRLRSDGISSEDRDDERLAKRLGAVKVLKRSTTVFDRKDEVYSRNLASEVSRAHEVGTITLVILNRVARAQQLYLALRKAEKNAAIALIHSRFRPADRVQVQNEVLSGKWTGIVVATQAVEAGVDLSARTMFTELAPWSSLVQRFGRCNRTGEFDTANVYWIDIPDDEKDAKPYDRNALAFARRNIESLADVGITALPVIREGEGTPEGPVLRRRELLELFDTQPDLSGSDTDVSRYIRATDDHDVQVYWRMWDGDKPVSDDQPHRDELCNVPCWSVADVAKRAKGLVFRWNGLARAWERPGRIVPGMQILLHGLAGGYDAEVGWLTASKRPVEAITRDTRPQDAESAEETSTLESRFVTIAEHTEDVVLELETILRSIADDIPKSHLRVAAHWHDVGKAHPAFQDLLLSAAAADDPNRNGGPWAKSPSGRGGRISRPYFRHELVSSLALLSAGGGDLEAYLVAAHHGKVRLSIRSKPGEPPYVEGRRNVLGVRDGDVIGPLEIGELSIGRVEMNLSIAELGERDGSASWLGRMLSVLDEFGPFRLAYLEALLRAADWRASEHLLQPSAAGI